MSPRAQTDDELALAGLRREVKAGRPGAANALARHLRGTSRDTTITRRRQAAIDKKALTSVSRSKQIDGPNSPEGMAERTLAWLMEGDDEHDPDETAAIDAEHAALRAAQAAEPDHLDRSPAEIAAQAAQDAQMREHQAWFRQMRDFDNTNQKGPHK